MGEAADTTGDDDVDARARAAETCGLPRWLAAAAAARAGLGLEAEARPCNAVHWLQRWAGIGRLPGAPGGLPRDAPLRPYRPGRFGKLGRLGRLGKLENW